MNFKNIFIFVAFLILSACSSKYSDSIQLDHNYSKGIMDIEKDDRYVEFTLDKNNKIHITSTKSNFSDSDFSRINEYNENIHKKNRSELDLKSCIKLSNTKPDICSNLIKEDIYTQYSQDILSGLLLSPFNLLNDVIEIISFKIPKRTIKGFVKKTRDDEFLIKISKYIDKELYQNYLKSKNQDRLNEFYSRHDLPYLKKLTIKNYRSKNNFNNYLKSFELSQDKHDLKKATKLSKSKKEKLIVENLLIKNLEFSKIFQVRELSSSSNSEFHNLNEENIPFLKNISEISSSSETFKKKFEITPNILLVGSYKLNIDFILEKTIKVKSNLFQGWLGQLANMISSTDKKVYNRDFYITKRNGYRDVKEIKYSIVSASTSALGMNMRSKIVGLSYTIKLKSATRVDQ